MYCMTEQDSIRGIGNSHRRKVFTGPENADCTKYCVLSFICSDCRNKEKILSEWAIMGLIINRETSSVENGENIL